MSVDKNRMRRKDEKSIEQKPRPSGLTLRERQIWNRVTKNIRPLNENQGEEISVETPTPPPPKQKTGTLIVKKKVVPKPQKIQNRESERQVKRGKVQINAVCDLHFYSENVAHVIMKEFVVRKRREGCRCVLVITGKGHGGEGRIRRSFRLWLETKEAYSLISGYSQAHYKHGGEGAFYLFLRRPR